MGGPFPLITLLVVAVSQHAVSATNCFTTNCEFVVREECQTSVSVICSMKDRPLKQINITEASFPRDVRRINITDAEAITIEADSISSLTSLKFIEITNVSNLILQNGSLARGGKSKQITVMIRAVKSLQIHSETLAGWRGDSRIIIEDVDDCQMFQHSIAKAHFHSFILNRIQSMVIHKNVFGNNTQILIIRIMNIASLSMSTGAFTFNVTVNNALFMDIENLTLHSGAIAKNTRIQEATLMNVPNLAIESTGIQAEIEELKLDNVTMKTCDEKAFGGNIGSLSLSSSHIHRTRKDCISANNGMNNLTIESSHMDQIDVSGIYGTVTEVQIKSSTFGTIAKEGLQLNVTKFSVENSTIEDASEKAFVVLADNDTTIRDCTIDVLQKDAFSSLRVKHSSEAAYGRIQLDNLYIKRPQNGSLLFDQSQEIRVHEIKTDIPCTCDMESTLGLDMASRHALWINQTLCKTNNTRPKLGDYLTKYCMEPTTTPSPTTDCPTTAINTNGDDISPIPPQTFDDSLDRVLQTISQPKNQPGDSPDHVQTGSSSKTILVAISTCGVLVVLVVIAFFAGRQVRHQSCFASAHDRDSRNDIRAKSQQMKHQILHGPRDSRACRPDTRPTISAPIQNDVTALSESTSHQTSAESGEVLDFPDQPTCGPNLRLATIALPCSDLVGTDESAFHQALALSSSASSPVDGPAATHTSNGMETGSSSQDVIYMPLRASRPNETPGWSAGGPRHYIDIPIYYTAPRRVPGRRKTETRRRGGSQDEVSHRPDEWYKLSASYWSNRPKDPRIQRLARDPQWALNYEPEAEV